MPSRRTGAAETGGQEASFLFVRHKKNGRRTFAALDRSEVIDRPDVLRRLSNTRQGEWTPPEYGRMNRPMPVCPINSLLLGVLLLISFILFFFINKL